jgi:fimbrial chaperone protein
LLLLAGKASASGLQVDPVMVRIQATQSAVGLTLSNKSDKVVRAQVRAYRWSQDEGVEHLTASNGVVVSPPMVELPPGGSQLVRIIRAEAGPSGPGATEATYRLKVNELPVSEGAASGVQLVFAYSIPVFVDPLGRASTPEKLQWTLEHEDGSAVLRVTNSGGQNARITNLAFVGSDGRREGVDKSLTGYVLPGSTMRWKLKHLDQFIKSNGHLEAQVNGRVASIEEISFPGSDSR